MGSPGASSAMIEFDISGEVKVDYRDHPAGTNQENNVASYSVGGRFRATAKFTKNALGLYTMRVDDPDVAGFQIGEAEVLKPGKFPDDVAKHSNALTENLAKIIDAKITSQGRVAIRLEVESDAERDQLL